jgi:hypothetical protein
MGSDAMSEWMRSPASANVDVGSGQKGRRQADLVAVAVSCADCVWTELRVSPLEDQSQLLFTSRWWASLGAALF